MAFEGTYRAKCVRVDGDVITLYIPQVFATTQVTTSSRTGAKPAPGDTGWVMFEGGQAQYPVWVSSTGATAGSTDDDVIYLRSASIYYGLLGPIIVPIPDSWVGSQVDVSLMFLTFGYDLAHVIYNESMIDPENPLSYITPPDEYLPWLEDSRYLYPRAMVSVIEDTPYTDSDLEGAFPGGPGTLGNLPGFKEVEIRRKDFVRNSFRWVNAGTTPASHNHLLLVFDIASLYGGTTQGIDYPEVTYPDLEHSIDPFAVPLSSIRLKRL